MTADLPRGLPRPPRSGRFWILRRGSVYPATVLEWGEWFNDIDNRRVARSIIGAWKISTVFVGVETQLFETMVFHPFREGALQYRRASRYGRRSQTMINQSGDSVWACQSFTQRQARADHRRAMLWVRAQLRAKNALV